MVKQTMAKDSKCNHEIDCYNDIPTVSTISVLTYVYLAPKAQGDQVTIQTLLFLLHSSVDILVNQ